MILIIYLIGVLVAIPLNISVFVEDKIYNNQHHKQLTLSGLFCALLLSVLSWFEVCFLLSIILFKCIENSDEIVIWKSKK